MTVANLEITEQALITDIEAQDKYIDRIDVLDRVGGLLLLPNMEMATTRQVAEFFVVNKNVIDVLYIRHKDELELDGIVKVKGAEMKRLKGDLQRVSDPENYGLGKYVNTVNLFPKRAILRVGMLLTDSEVAKEIRTQLLNVVNHVHDQQPQLLTQDISEEKLLMIDVGKAMMDGNVQALMVATAKLSEFKNRHINQLTDQVQVLETKVNVLADGLTNYDNDWKELFKICATKLDQKRRLPFGTSYTEIYANLAEQTEINVFARKRQSGTKKSYITFIQPHEWEEVVKVTIAYAEKAGIDMSGLFKAKLV